MTFGLVKFLNSKKPSAHVAKPNSFTTASQIIRYLLIYMVVGQDHTPSFFPSGQFINYLDSWHYHTVTCLIKKEESTILVMILPHRS